MVTIVTDQAKSHDNGLPRDSSLTQEDNEHCLNAKNVSKTDKIKQQQTKKIKLKKMGAGEFNKNSTSAGASVKTWLISSKRRACSLCPIK